MLQRARIEERLKTRARLAAGLGHVIPGIAEVIEATDQSDHRSIVRIESDQRALHGRYLRQLGRAVAIAQHVDQITALQERVGLAVGGIAARPGHAVPLDLRVAAATQVHARGRRRDRDHHRRLQVADRRHVGQQILQLVRAGAGTELGVANRTSITVATVVFDQPEPQRAVGGGL